jgi:deaminated glutathione amidase
MSSPDARLQGDGSDRLTVAAVQITSGADWEANIARAQALVRRAAAAGARLVVLPEKWPYIHGPRTAEGAEPLDGPSVAAAAGWARELGVAILAGSIIERTAAGRAHNTSLLLGPDGAVAGVYRKIHMFDVDVDGTEYRESAATVPGTEIVAADVLGRRVGMSVCYDLRFPELYRALMSPQPCDLFVMGAAFTHPTGQAHWEVLLRARAIENQCHVLASAQGGTHANGRRTWGHSLAIDPWGVVQAIRPEGEGVVMGRVDRARQADVRRQLPALTHRVM